MGTDIFSACEVRKNGKWTYNRKKIFPLWDDKKTNIPIIYRDYNLFAVLANVRNGVGFAGVTTGDEFNYIDEPRGLPDGISDAAKKKLFQGGYGESWYTLTELKNFNWLQLHKTLGVVSYDEYEKTAAIGERPNSWCSWVGGKDVIIVDESQFPLKQMKKDKLYYVSCEFPAETYDAECGYFYSETIPILESLIPVGGTSDDVRIVFNFDC